MKVERMSFDDIDQSIRLQLKCKHFIYWLVVCSAGINMVLNFKDFVLSFKDILFFVNRNITRPTTLFFTSCKINYVQKVTFILLDITVCFKFLLDMFYYCSNVHFYWQQK